MWVDRAAAREFARRYLDPATGWAYPAYDAYDRERARGPLVDTDVLALVLLNVQMKISTYRNLLAVRDELQHKLDRLPECNGGRTKHRKILLDTLCSTSGTCPPR
jgi:hypothetical protein